MLTVRSIESRSYHGRAATENMGSREFGAGSRLQQPASRRQ